MAEDLQLLEFRVYGGAWGILEALSFSPCVRRNLWHGVVKPERTYKLWKTAHGILQRSLGV